MLTIPLIQSFCFVSAKEYRYKVANGIVSEFSSRICGAPDHRVSHEMNEHANPGIMHLPLWRKENGANIVTII